MKDYLELSKKHFDGQSKIYDETNTAYYSKYPKISCRDVAEKLNNIEYNTMLDIGCGTGYLIDILQKQRAADYYGLDLSPEMLKVAKSKLSDSVALTEGYSDKLPYNDNTFDVVTCIQSFHHYPKPEKAMAEAYRVLKPGGLYILSDTGMGRCPKFMYAIYNKLIVKHFNTGDYAAYSNNDIQNRMCAAGFKIQDAQDITKFIYTVIGVK
ncbi:MAG: class I SAM-dependent methyltransferase [Acetobacter sp.]|nr:class I SAM-dependent methyltransferase [Bacteroides sp.]MCM1340137.1 class I SAM-dependent methyltransferase [Acetobacter sp.]MCM1432719.1 class I SAM-dependent methyltransferase [Clostridiales bacterium]